MLIGVPREQQPGEHRAAMIPAMVQKLTRAGADIVVEAGLGSGAGFSDEDFVAAGARIVRDRVEMLSGADLVLRLHKPSTEDIALLKRGCIHVSYLDPFNEAALIEAFRAAGVTAISMEMIPRTTRSQKMDALSSQANLAGYVMVLLAAARMPRIMAMMMTPAGTLKPANVFVIGAGVAGLQAIATAKRLGARVVAFDTRAVVAEQVQSLGAKFLEIDLGETGQTKDGYAVQLTSEQLEKQKQGQKKQIAESDLVITTAQVFGRKPPVLVTRDMVEGMKPGSVIVDMAAETGGNVEGSVAGQSVEINGVTIIGTGNWANQVPRDASQMYSSNLFNLIDEFWDKEQKAMVLDFGDDIIQGCVITHGGEIVNQTIKNLQR
ncbi:MAG: Re/Si-specific NAD(P)(+) transhydrogenase subunit alpha [Gammaproteobacteria bacterium]|jgi:NAD(P) transhydrogenase subunit alpha|nr:Re/Si-specific NAD(P)(+) transhydrogenase subunit alpha [Gammaproteobacteria bacterium]MBP6053399.1 Re/Si-specific NAD(P)(+) transhydrogenase subunit alpha [Pseudomonadales bacterium]MBK6585196.1 Re/Si-specific NAD(P)(+) transhydrogenase subunit alpha [Gammaproteobacteria bacterium]MBK7169073.1 Re/Si-specific NAD(P)(+) transhydrogenase subunit alpha [Gammaproteobacteria bacterium]MBK7520081.1 Re/Si-specific NAD(P)(+) transhydrogenase subunit alpha [Gammaproteobacteria bacterium]